MGFATEVKVKTAEVQRLRATADQMAMEIANGVSVRAVQLSADLSVDDMTAFLRAIAEAVR